MLAARRRRPDAPEPWIDLSTGINPVPYPLPPIPPAALQRLPEPEEVAALEAAAASAYGVRDPACVVAAPGTQALIHLLPRLLPPTRVEVLSPTYAEHAAAWRLAGHGVAEAARLTDAPVTVVVRPNNPNGAVLPMAELLAAAGRGLLVVDEAFADFDLPALPAGARVLRLRSFGKTYGLPGLRLGFAVAPPDWAARIRAALGPWPVSGPAIFAGTRALADAAWRTDAASRLGRDTARLDALLVAAGGTLVGGTRLFRLYAHPAAPALAERLARHGILVRTFDTRPDHLRFGLPADEAAWSRLAAALA